MVAPPFSGSALFISGWRAENAPVPRSSHPPLPSITKPLIWLLRSFGVLILASASYAAVLAVARERWDLATLALVVGVGFAVLTWIHPLSPWFAGLLASIGLVTAWATQRWATAAGAVALAGLILWWPRRARFPGAVTIPVDRIRVAEPGAVMRGARPVVDEFARHGFAQVGAIVIPIGPLRVVESLLLSEDGLSYAAVTDAIVHVTSLFPDGRSLVTRNSDLGAQPPEVLVDSLPGGSPAELIDSHRRALALVAERDHYPVSVSEQELPALAIEGERATVEWSKSQRGSRSATAQGQLWNRLGRYQQIDDWHGAGTKPDQAS